MAKNALKLYGLIRQFVELANLYQRVVETGAT
jgi:hypothetical protein